MYLCKQNFCTKQTLGEYEMKNSDQFTKRNELTLKFEARSEQKKVMSLRNIMKWESSKAKKAYIIFGHRLDNIVSKIVELFEQVDST